MSVQNLMKRKDFLVEQEINYYLDIFYILYNI